MNGSSGSTAAASASADSSATPIWDQEFRKALLAWQAGHQEALVRAFALFETAGGESKEFFSNLVGVLIDTDKATQSLLKTGQMSSPILTVLVTDGDCGCGAGMACKDGDYGRLRKRQDTDLAKALALLETALADDMNVLTGTHEDTVKARDILKARLAKGG